MSQQLLWIVAVLGAGTLIGTFLKMKGGFGPINLRAIGIVLIAVLASLLAMTSQENITAAMGILGAIAGYLFGAEAKEQAAVGTTGVNAVGAQFGDNSRVAGGDMIETVNNIERMLGDLHGLTQATIQNVEMISDRISTPHLIRHRTERFQWASTDPAFVNELRSLSQNRAESWSQAWIDRCLERPECLAKIREVANSRILDGWVPCKIEFDNHGEGIHVNLQFQREFKY